MCPVGAALAITGVVGAGATIYGANKAAGAQVAGADKATAANREMFDITRKGLDPYMQAGNANAALMSKLLTPNGVDMSVLESLPGYQFDRMMGERALTNSASARGLALSGSQIGEFSKFNTGLADKYFGEHFNRLYQGASLGANAAAGLGTNATATGSNIASNALGAGNAQAGSYMAGANAVGGLGGDLTNAYLMSKIMGGGMYGANAAAPPPGSYATNAAAANGLLGF